MKQGKNFISQKLRSIQWQFVLMGTIFFAFGVATLFFPAIIQILFILGFFVISFIGFAIALRMKHLADFVDKVFAPIGNKRKKR